MILRRISVTCEQLRIYQLTLTSIPHQVSYVFNLNLDSAEKDRGYKMTFDFDKEFQNMMQKYSLNTVILLGHLNPDGDAAGSVMGLAHYIKVNYPQYRVIPYLEDTLDKGPKKQVKADRVFDPLTKPDITDERYAVIICDTAVLSRLIGKEYYECAETSMVIDHHASNEGYGDINYIKISEACAENVYYILDQAKLKKTMISEMKPTAADYIYMGILHDTGCLSRAKMSTMQAVTGLLELGVEHSYVMQTMHNDTLESLQTRAGLLERAERLLDGKIACVCVSRAESEAEGIGYEDIHPISEILRDCEDIELGFTMYEEEENRWRCSFRSDGKWINVNELLQKFGGGGHAAAAGVRKRTNNMEKFRQDILEEIIMMRKNIGKERA